MCFSGSQIFYPSSLTLKYFPQILTICSFDVVELILCDNLTNSLLNSGVLNLVLSGLFSKHFINLSMYS